MKYLKTYESGNRGTPCVYRKQIREYIDIIRKFIGEQSKDVDLILKLIATNKTVYTKYGSYFKNIEDFLDNIENIVKTVATTILKGIIGELIVKYVLENKYKLKVDETTDEEDISGIDLISYSNQTLKHQVKTIDDYEDNGKDLEILGSKIDIKTNDVYDYLWLYVRNKSELISFRKKNINITYKYSFYSIAYTDKKKIKIGKKLISKLEKELESILFDDFIDDIREKRDDILTFVDSQKYNL